MPVDIKQHDFTKPYTPEEEEQLKAILRTFPTYKDEKGDGEGYILPSDCPHWWSTLGWIRTPEQVAAYQGYWDYYYKDGISMEIMLETCNAFHDTCLMLVRRVRVLDLDGDGYIDEDEFHKFLKICVRHEPKFSNIPYEQLVREADANGDGKVSVEEFQDWLCRALKKGD